MTPAPIPIDEHERLRALHSIDILDTPSELEFDALVQLAADTCDVPIASLTLIDGARVWLKSSVGTSLREAPREISLSAHAILGDDILTVPDTHIDPRFADNPLVTGDLNIRFFAGVPVRAIDRAKIGTLVVADHHPRRLTDRQRRALELLGRQVEALFELRVRRRAALERRGPIFERDRFFELSIDPMCVASTSGYFLRVNGAFQRVLGYTAEELTARPYTELVHPDDLGATAAEATALATEARGSVRFENRYRARDGSYRWISWTSVTDLEDGLIYAIARDVTDQRQLEAQLVHAQKMEAIGRLAGGIAHDFNNLLSAILGFGELVAEELPEGTLGDDMQEVLRAAELAANLTRQLLLFSRRSNVEPPRRIDVNERITELQRILRLVVGSQIDISMRPAEDLWTTVIDPGHLEQIVMNLAINARDAMGGKGLLTVETANVFLDAGYANAHLDVTAGEYVLLAVSDTGCGMDAELQQRIFEPFFTTKAPGQGTGLGLATVFGIVKEAGGHLWVYSEPGHGSTFKIYLPRSRSPRAADAIEAIPNVRGTETILLVEDDPAVREFVRRALTRLGYSVIATAAAAQALDAQRSTDAHVDLVVTDLILPGVRGDELAARLRATAPDQKILFMSGYTENALDHRQMLDGRTRFIEKPLSLQRLGRVVREILDTRVAA